MQCNKKDNKAGWTSLSLLSKSDNVLRMLACRKQGHYLLQLTIFCDYIRCVDCFADGLQSAICIVLWYFIRIMIIGNKHSMQIHLKS